MKLSDTIKRHEGFKGKPYKCTAGIWTFGYGFTSISRDEAQAVLDIKISKLETVLHGRINTLSKPRQEVLINMAFNLGINGLYNFKRMWAAIDNEDYNLASLEMLNSKWASQVWSRAKYLAETMRAG